MIDAIGSSAGQNAAIAVLADRVAAALNRPAIAPAAGSGASADLGEDAAGQRQRGAETLSLTARLRDEAEARASASDQGAGPDGLTPEQERVVQQMKARDREVRNHEQAHVIAGGEYAGSPSYTYETGPDGRNYAVGGQVPIDVAPIADDPEATIEKMEVVKRAALAPAEPSGADRQVAALADAQRLQAMADLAELRRQEVEAASSSQTTSDAIALYQTTQEPAPAWERRR